MPSNKTGRGQRPGNMNPPKLTPDEEKAAKAVMKQMDKFSGKSEGELMREAAKLAKKGKADGELSPDNLKKFERSISGYLDEGQKRKLGRIMKTLRKELE